MQMEYNKETQRLLSSLDMKTGALNFDFFFAENGKFYFLELGPRNRGFLIPEVIRHAKNIDLIKATVGTALGLDCSSVIQTPPKCFWSSYMVHSITNVIFDALNISNRAKKMIVEQNIYVSERDKVKKYSDSNDTLDVMIDNKEHNIHVSTLSK